MSYYNHADRKGSDFTGNTSLQKKPKSKNSPNYLIYYAVFLMIIIALPQFFHRHDKTTFPQEKNPLSDISSPAINGSTDKTYFDLHRAWKGRENTTDIKMASSRTLNSSLLSQNRISESSIDNHSVISTTESSDVDLRMPWENGIWTRKPSHLIPPTFSEAAKYANSLHWTRRGIRKKVSSAIKSATSNRFLHIINPYSTRNAAAEAVQNMSLASIETARAWIQFMEPEWTVDVLTVESAYESPEMSPWRPSTFLQLDQPLNLTAFDVMRDTFNATLKKRPFPLLREILSSGVKGMSPTDSILDAPYSHVIFTNMDIGVMPHFYAIVNSMAKCLRKSFFINRVEIPSFKITKWKDFHLLNDTRSALSDEPINLSSLATAYNYTAAFAQLHPGYDCLVAKIDVLPKILQGVGDVFTAFPPVGSVLCEAVKIAENACTTVKSVSATFHVGSRNGDWEGGDAAEYIRQNALLAKAARKGLKKRPKCKAVQFRSNSGRYHQCFPGDYYNSQSKKLGKYMFPMDFKDLAARKKNKKQWPGTTVNNKSVSTSFEGIDTASKMAATLKAIHQKLEERNRLKLDMAKAVAGSLAQQKTKSAPKSKPMGTAGQLS